MKKLTLARLAFMLVFAVSSSVAYDASAQAVTTTTTSAVGTISEFSPDTIILRTESNPEPVRYTYTKKTVYVDEAGAPVSIETVKSGLPVTVYYAREGDRLIADRVVVNQA